MRTKPIIPAIASAFLLISSFIITSCGSDDPDGPTPPDAPAPETPAPPAKETGFARGADVSWLTKMESEGLRFYTPAPEWRQSECMQLLRDYCGVNSIRLRVWVNPADGWCGVSDVVAKARRAEGLGLRTMIDFHLSDTWADPGHQEKPAAWAALSGEALEKAVADHISETLNTLKNAGVTPEWVQVGNEITPGMLLPDGSVDNPAQLTRLVNAGYDAVKGVFLDAKVIVHLDKGEDQWRYDRLLELLEANGGRYDMIGMSLYPYDWERQDWREAADACAANVSYLKRRYGKPVMICETGVPHDRPEACRDMLTRMMTADVEGIFYWEPQAPAGYNGGYTLGCFDRGAPTAALSPFKAAARRKP